MYTDNENIMNMLFSMDENRAGDGIKTPIWLDETSPGLFFKVSVPKFMHSSLFKYDEFIGSDVNIAFNVRDYESEEFGKGWYLVLGAELTKAD